MSKVAVVTDSTAYIPENLVKQHNITVAPQVLIWGEETFKDGIDILPSEFYHRLKNTDVMPTTSQVSPLAMKNLFENLIGEGYSIVGIFISSLLSGTIQSATQALEDMTPAMKEKVAVVDSRTTAMAMGFQALMVARAAQAGESLDECHKLALQTREHTGVLFTVETLEFLKRGGRIGGAQAMLGTVLNIKPILEVKDGRIEGVEKVRTKGKAIERVVEIVSEQIAGRKPVRIATLHANAEAEAQSLLEMAAGQLDPVEKILATVSPVIGNHTGPGTVGLAYMAGL
ncbi:MAG: DegV family protein [Chloroflexota bacterium]